VSKSTPAALPRRARFKPYPEYRDSGVEWLGEVPVHWGDARLSKLTTLLNGYPFDSGYFVRGEGVPLVRIRDLNAIETEVNYVGPVVPTAWIEPGDVIVGDGRRLQRCPLAGPACSSQSTDVLPPPARQN
jgi:hypothetical protein